MVSRINFTPLPFILHPNYSFIPFLRWIKDNSFFHLPLLRSLVPSFFFRQSVYQIILFEARKRKRERKRERNNEREDRINEVDSFKGVSSRSKYNCDICTVSSFPNPRFYAHVRHFSHSSGCPSSWCCTLELFLLPPPTQDF